MDKTWIIIICIIAFAVFICFLLAVANYSYDKFMDKYQKLNRRSIRNEVTPMQFVAMLDSQIFNGNLSVVQIDKVAGDAYSSGRLFLSTQTINNPSIASYTIIAHEIGHAKQDIEGNKIKRLNFLRRLGRLIGFLMSPLLIAGLIMLFLGEMYTIIGYVLLACGVGIFILALVIKIMTISIEKDASKKAVEFLDMILNEEELRIAKKFLNDARMTYWADFLKIILGWTAMSKKGKLFN